MLHTVILKAEGKLFPEWHLFTRRRKANSGLLEATEPSPLADVPHVLSRPISALWEEECDVPLATHRFRIKYWPCIFQALDGELGGRRRLHLLSRVGWDK